MGCICTHKYLLPPFISALWLLNVVALEKGRHAKSLKRRTFGRRESEFVVGLALESCAEGFHFSRIHEKSMASL